MHAAAPGEGADGTTEFQHGEEHDLSFFKKMLLAAVAGMVLAIGLAASPASATVPTEGKADAEQANVPYLAWRGEHVRLGYCNLSSPQEGYQSFSGEDIVSWHIEDWSGHDYGSIPVPYMTLGSSQYENGCVYARFGSQKPGVAFIKLTIISSTTGNTLVDKHFLVGWMQLTNPVLTGGGAVTAGDIDCQPQIVFAERIRSDQTDPRRVCPRAYDPKHLITATVKGIIPLDANFDEWVFPATGPLALKTPGQLTLPDDWAAWANVAARDNIDRPNTVVPSPVPTNWDIHDSQASALDNHVATGGVQCDPPEINTPGTTDTVDNCAYDRGGYGAQAGPFSTVFGERSAGDAYGRSTRSTRSRRCSPTATSTWATRPCRPRRSTSTSRRTRAAPTLAAWATCSGGQERRAQPRRSGHVAAHNYDSPFYSQWLPATSRPPDGSGSPFGAVAPTGIDGASTTSNTGGFSGFLHNNGYGGLYRNWDFAWETSYHPRTLSQCLWYQSVFLTYEAHYRPLPYGTSSVSVYTDEHGEADMYFIPGFGFYFPKGDSNGGCDLELLDDPLGTAHITVTARYPYQPVTIGDPAATLDYAVNSEFEKTLRVLPKGGSATPDRLTRVVLAHAQDIDGYPLQYETVCWTSNNLAGGAISAFPSGPGGDLYAAYSPTALRSGT